MPISKSVSNHNFKSFLWHAGFLAFAQNFIDVDVVIPSMVMKSGGTALHIGIMSTIMLGGSSFTQILFSPYISNKTYKKKYLLTGINLRILSLIGLAVLLLYSNGSQSTGLLLTFIFITIFSLSGAFANVSYTDILGKSINDEKRKSFLSTKQIIGGIVVLLSAFIAKKMLQIREYPINYSIMFIIGAISLLIASGGFWAIKETESSKLTIPGFKDFLILLKNELSINKKLKYFLGFINTQGIAISFLPFVVLYAKNHFNTQTTDTGLFLLFKVLGVITVSFAILLGVKKIKYNALLYSNVFLTVIMAVIVIFAKNSSYIKYIFILGGIVYSLYTITMNGVLLELSKKENRTIYTGLTGAGNILPAIFPIIGGLTIRVLGYNAFFALFILIILSSTYFIYKINCRK